MIEPAHHVVRGMQFRARGQGRPVDHQDGYAKGARRHDFGLRAGAACIFGDDKVDGVRLHQFAVAFERERPAIDDQAVARQGRRGGGRIDETQQILMLRLGEEGIRMHTPQREHDAAGRTRQRCDRSRDVSHMGPAIPFLRAPCRARQGDMRDAGQAGGLDRMGAHRRGEGVGRVDQMSDAMHTQIIDQPGHAAKPADAHGDGLRHRPVGAPRIAERCRNTLIRQQSGQRARLRCAAQQQDIVHG